MITAEEIWNDLIEEDGVGKQMKQRTCALRQPITHKTPGWRPRMRDTSNPIPLFAPVTTATRCWFMLTLQTDEDAPNCVWTAGRTAEGKKAAEDTTRAAKTTRRQPLDPPVPIQDHLSPVHAYDNLKWNSSVLEVAIRVDVNVTLC